MKNKLFIAFSGIIFLGLLSNMVFALLIYRDFNAYSMSLREDQLGWVKASIETSWSHGQWNRQALVDALHWGLMLGFYIKVYDKKGNLILNSEDVLRILHPEMKRRMEETIDLKKSHALERSFEIFAPEHHKEERPKEPSIGKILVESLTPWGIAKEKEEAFKKKLLFFLVSSIIFVTGSSLLIAYLLSYLISRPFMKLKDATERLRKGDLYVRIETSGRDEISLLAQSFNRLTEDLRREDELRRHLSSQLTHELRTPLTVLKANIEALKDGMMETEKAIENMEPEIERLKRLVEGMEEIVKAEASLFTRITPEKLDISQFLKKVIEPFEPEFRKKGLYLEIKAEPLLIRTDPEKLSIILRNLLSNSLRYTDRGGLTISAQKDKEGLILTLTDTGKGIEPSRLPYIFKRFYRDETSEGLGIGLSIVEGLIRLLDGSIEVKSEQGKGTAFIIRLKSLA